MSVFTNLDQPLFDGSDATKGDLVDHLEACAERILAELRGRPLSVVRARPGQAPFMQKNLPKHAPATIRTVTSWAQTSHRDVRYALCDDLDTLRWFANQRAVEYHVPLVRAADPEHPTHLILDLDPPEGDGFAAAVRAAQLVREVLDGLGLANVVKTSGAKGVHVGVPVAGVGLDDAAAATRAIAARAAALDPAVATTAFLKDERHGKVFVDATRVGAATVVAAYSPRIRPGTPVSFPVAWEALGDVRPADFTVASVRHQLEDAGPWLGDVAAATELPADLLAEGHEIPPPRMAALNRGSARRAPRGRPPDR